MTAEFALRLDGATYRHGAMAMRFDLAVPSGEWLAVIGPSGAGKSTLIDLVAGFLQPDAGAIAIAGRNATHMPPFERPLSVVFQDNNLFTHLDVFRNVALGIAPTLKLGTADRRAVSRALDAVGLAGFETRRPAEMSGGERQRVALARAFLRDRPLLLLDEPFAALGPALRAEMLALLDRMRASRSGGPLTIVMVTHHPHDALGHAARTAFVEAGQIAAIGPTEALLDASSGPVASYLGR